MLRIPVLRVLLLWMLTVAYASMHADTQHVDFGAKRTSCEGLLFVSMLHAMQLLCSSLAH